MGADKNPPNGTPPLLNLQNVQMDTEPNCPAAAVQNALSEIQNLEKADHGFTTFRNPGGFLEDLPRKIEGRSVLCEGFSIREYVAKVRSVDIRKCWPLCESLLEDSLREGRTPPLPPLVRPNYRWWSCHQCLEIFGEHRHFGASFNSRNSLRIERPENNFDSFDHIIGQQLTVSLDTDPETGPGIFQDLDEQIRKLSRVKISGQEDSLNIARSEDAIKNIEDTSERVDKGIGGEHGRNIIVPSRIKDRRLKTEARKCTSVTEGNAQLERLHIRVKGNRSDGTKAHKDLENQTRAKHSTFHLMRREGDLLNDIGNGKKKRTKAMGGPYETAYQAGAESVTLESEGSKIDNLNSEKIKIDSRRHNNFDIGSSEGSGVKICPVCTTFTSATITAVNAHIDNCLAQASTREKRQKQKSRMRKKRSIVDICAASPPVQVSLEYLDNFQMDGDTNESAGSHRMDANSYLAIEVTANGAVTQDMNSIPTGSEDATQNDSSTVKSKRKQPADAHYLIESGKCTNGDGQPESLETKRRRQRVGMITCVFGFKDLKETLKTAKMPSSAQSTGRHEGVEHHIKDSSKLVKFREDSNGERTSSMQLNSKEHCDVRRDVLMSLVENEQQCSATVMEDITPHPTTEHSVTMLPEESCLECSINHIRSQGGESRKLRAESIREHSSVPAISNGTVKNFQLSAVGDTVLSWYESPHVHTEKPQELGDSECTLKNRGNTESCRLQVEEDSSKQGVQNFINESIDLGMMGKSEELNAQHGIATCSKYSVVPPGRPNVSPQHDTAKFRIDFVDKIEGETSQHVYSNHNLGGASNSLCLQSVDRTRAKLQDLNSSRKATLIQETINVTEGSVKNTRLNLSQKVSVLPRDCKGRFISSARMQGGKEGELSYSRWKQTESHKVIKQSNNSINASTIPPGTNFAMNAALSNAGIGKSTSMQTIIPLCKDYGHGGKKCLSRYRSVPELNGTVAGQATFLSGGIETFSVGREAPLAITTLNHVEAPLSEKAIDLVKFFIQSRCSDYGYIGLPLDSHGELIKYIPNTTAGNNQLYRIQNSTTYTEPSVTECSKRLPKLNLIESMDVSSNISEVRRTPKIPSDSILCNCKCPSLQNYTICCKQADCCNQHSASKINQMKLDQAGLVQSSSLCQIQCEYVGDSQIRTFGSSIRKTDTSSTLTVCMHSTVESGYNVEHKQNSSLLEQSFPEVLSLRKALPIPQAVMRLMGHNFTIGRENEAGNSLKKYQQGSGIETPTTSEATLDASSPIKSNTVHSGHYIACIDGQLHLSYSGLNSIGKSTISDFPPNNFKPMQSPVACNTTEELKRLSSSVPKLVEKSFRTSRVPCEQSFRGQFYSEPTWTSISPFCTPTANTLSSPLSHLSSNTRVNQVDNMVYKYSCNPMTSEMGQTELSRSGCNLHGTYLQNTLGHIRDPARLHQYQVYSENQNSSLVPQSSPIPVCNGCISDPARLHQYQVYSENQHSSLVPQVSPIPVCNGCIHTSRIREAPGNPGSLPNQSDTLQSLQNNFKCNSSLPQWLLKAQKQTEANERTRYNEKQSSAPVPSSRELESVTKQLPCLISCSVSFSDPPHTSTLARAHPTSVQTASPSHCETLNSSASPTDSVALAMHGRYKHSSTDLFERDNMKLLRNMSKDICVIGHEKDNVPDTVDLVSPESKRPGDPRTGTRKEIVQEKNGLHGKWLPQSHEGCAQGSSKKCDLLLTGQKLHKRKRVIHHQINSSSTAAKRVMNKERSENDFIGDMGVEICILNANSVEFDMGKDSQDGGECSKMNKVSETFSNAFVHSGLPKKCRENGGALTESQFGTFRVGLNSSNTESPLELAEPVKLSGGAKHILKPPSQKGNAKQSLPIHYTLPFAQTTAEVRDRYFHVANRYSGEQQRTPPGSKLLRWASRSNSSLSLIPSKMETADSHP